MSDRRDAIRRVIEANDEVSMAQLLTATKLTRPGVLYHLNQLIAAHEIEHAGHQRGRSVRYRAAYDNRWDIPVDTALVEHGLWSDLKASILHDRMTEPAREIHAYVFGEMVNNVLEHANSEKLLILHRVRGDETWLSVRDNGVGIFEKIAAAEGLADSYSSIRKLQSGAYTTAPDGHTGQGIFFSSRAVDEFSVGSGEITWITDNTTGEQTLRQQPIFDPGTTVSWSLRDTSDRSLTGLFDYFSILDDDEIPQFATTSIAVSAAIGDSQYVTRSAARELLQGKEQFQVVILDFANVPSVGQGFADEAFRVFPASHRDVSIVAVNMIEPVAWFVNQAQEAFRRQKPDR